MLQPDLEFHVERSLAEAGYRFYAASTDRRSYMRTLMLPAQFRDFPPGERAEPALLLTDSAAQNLIDELWRAGVRPSEHGSPGQLKATERHLEDMQAIAIGLLRRDGVEL